MTVTPTYPGVYVREIPSGNRTITGVATSITAFVGTAPRGPVDDPVAISGFGDFERVFGGLSRAHGLGYAVRDYYLNGGSEALVVRVAHLTAGKDEKGQDESVADVASSARLNVGKTEGQDQLALDAKGPGAWGSALRATVSHPDPAVASDVAAGQGVAPGDLFTLKVTEGVGPDAPSETYVNLTVADGPQRFDLVLASSRLVRVVTLAANKVPTKRPAAGDYYVARLEAGGLVLGPSTKPELWMGEIKVTVAKPTGTDEELKAESERQGVPTSALFDLTLVSGSITEPYKSVNVVRGPQRIDTVLLTSAIARVVDLPKAAPTVGEYKLAAGTKTLGLDGKAPTATDYLGKASDRTGIHALRKADLFTLLCIPPGSPSGELDKSVWSEALALCRERRAFLIVDPPVAASRDSIPTFVTDAGLAGLDTRNAALYFPRIQRSDPLRGGATASFVPCGAVAGTYARTDTSRGIWKAPAGLEAGLAGVVGLPLVLNDDDSAALNPKGINCLRTLRGSGTVIWGTRTLRGADVLADEYAYVPVRRLALYLEESLFRATHWVVFEPNDEPLWAQIRLAVGGFMQNLFRQGAFQGMTPRDAYFVRCDSDTTTQYDIDRGVVNILVGFAPLKPAEFVVIGVQQKTATRT